MSKLTKTEQTIVSKLEKSLTGVYVVEAGIERGVSCTGRFKSYGTRERNAMRKLVEKGLVVVKRKHYESSPQGSCSEYVLELNR